MGRFRGHPKLTGHPQFRAGRPHLQAGFTENLGLGRLRSLLLLELRKKKKN
jgi:hypothetical protein